MTPKKPTAKKTSKAAGAAASTTTKKTAVTGASRKSGSPKASRKKAAARRASSAGGAATRSPDSGSSGSVSSAAPQAQNIREPYTSNSSAKYALAASLLALALSVYAVYDSTLNSSTTRVHLTGVEERLGAIASGQQGLRQGLDSQKAHSEEGINRIDTSLGGMQSTVEKLQIVAQESIDDIKANLGESVARWKLDEVHSLLTRVNRIYQITGDQAQAIAGLELTQSSLATIDNPRLAEVNTALAEDILRVKADRSIDIVSLNDRLVSISSVIPDLVLAEDAGAGIDPESEQAQEADDTGFLSAGKTLFGDIGSLVKHKNLDAPLQPTLDEYGRYVVYESLRLQVHAAMVALLRRDNVSYQSQLELAIRTLSTYFDAEQAATKTLRDQLEVLLSYDISLNAQAISRALSALNRVMVMEN